MKPPYSPAISKNSFVFVSGQIHLSNDGTLFEGTIEEQTQIIMKKIQAILEEAGSSLDNVVKVTIYTTDLSLYSQVNEVYMSYFPLTLPAREMVEVSKLPLGARLEISVIAAV